MYVYGLTHNAMTKWLHSLKGGSSHNKDNSRKWVATVTRGNRRDRGDKEEQSEQGKGGTENMGEPRKRGEQRETRGKGGDKGGQGKQEE